MSAVGPRVSLLQQRKANPVHGGLARAVRPRRAGAHRRVLPRRRADRRRRRNINLVQRRGQALSGLVRLGVHVLSPPKRTILFREEHSRRVLVPKVEFISAPGWSRPVATRGAQALLTGKALFALAAGETPIPPGERAPGRARREDIRRAHGFRLRRRPLRRPTRRSHRRAKSSRCCAALVCRRAVTENCLSLPAHVWMAPRGPRDQDAA